MIIAQENGRGLSFVGHCDIIQSDLLINSLYMSERTFTDANFQAEVLQNSMPVLVDFYADWCGPCKMQAPILEEVAREVEGKAVIGQLDVDANSLTAQTYGVMSIPTLLIFKAGQPVERLVGVHAKEALLAKLSQVIAA